MKYEEKKTTRTRSSVIMVFLVRMAPLQPLPPPPPQPNNVDALVYVKEVLRVHEIRIRIKSRRAHTRQRPISLDL